MANMTIFCELTIVIPRLPFPYKMAIAVSSTVEPANSVTSDSVDVFNLAM